MTIHETAKILDLPIIENEVRFCTLAEAEAFRALCDKPWTIPPVVYDFDTWEYCIYLKEE